MSSVFINIHIPPPDDGEDPEAITDEDEGTEDGLGDEDEDEDELDEP